MAENLNALKPLRIAHVLPSTHVGGAERVALMLTSAQHEGRHRVSLVSFEEPPEGELASEFEREGVTVHRVPKRAGGFDFTLSFRLAAHFRRWRPDVVHTHNSLPQIYAAFPARFAGACVVHTKHGDEPTSAKALLLRRAGAAATHSFVAVSEATAQFAREHREVAERKLRVIHNAIALERFARDDEVRAEVRREWGAGDATVVGTVGRMSDEKNHAGLIRAMAPLLARGAILVIAGDGAERARCDALAAELDVTEAIRFLGLVSDVPRVLSGLDVFALPSTMEGLPLVLAEAMAASLPVVASAVGGVPGVVVDDETGYLVPPNDEEGLRARIAELGADPALARRLGEKGLASATERFALQRMVGDYLDAYLSAMGQSAIF